MDGSVRLGPSTRTSSTRPTRFVFRLAATRWTTSTSRSIRSPFVSSGTWSGIEAASVPWRGLKTNVKALSKPASSTTSRVSAKSRSVSPGNPTMRSVVNARSGIAARILSTRARYRSREYVRRIAFRSRVEPDWSGRWACSQTAAHSAIAAMTSSRKSLGCGLVKRIRSIPSIESTARRSSPNSVRMSGTRSRPQEFTFWPSSVTSLTPSAASEVTSARMSPGRLLCSRPRTDGTMQYEHFELQPIEIWSQA